MADGDGRGDHADALVRRDGRGSCGHHGRVTRRRQAGTGELVVGKGEAANAMDGWGRRRDGCASRLENDRAARETGAWTRLPLVGLHISIVRGSNTVALDPESREFFPLFVMNQWDS
jgi:hypothetical protein